MDNLSIFELRHIAGELGIKYPSKLRRKDLIAEIKAVKSGKKKTAPKTNRGRPKKPLTTVAPDRQLTTRAADLLAQTAEKLSELESALRALLTEL